MADARVLLIFLVALLTLFFIAFIIILFTYINQLSSLIEPSQCPAVSNLYGIIPNTNGPIAQCGASPCSFSATTISEAINVCDANSLCQQFTWDGKTVTFVNRPLVNSVGTNVYVKP
jgi:hypothetical protein